MALTVTIFESAWNTTTTPKTVSVTGAVTGDWLAVIAGGDQSSGNAVSAATSSTTAGSTGAWTELAEDFDGGTSADWYHCAKAQVSADGSVTVQVDRTKAGAQGGMWGFYVIRGNDSGGVNLLGQLGTTGTTQVISGTPSQDSAVAIGLFDWNAGTAPTAWTPAGQTVVEATALTDYTVGAAYWTAQAAGTRNYGTTNWGGTPSIKGVAVEILANTGPPPPERSLRVVRSNLQL